jgi:predicted metalloprotease
VNYVNPRLVLFSGATRSRCGAAESAMGPFYCPIDRTVYLDLSFFNDMRRRVQAGGQFAYAYVISHEVGHHVENLLGVLPKVQEAQRESSQVRGNQLSVGVELMADCLAGVWANNSNQRWKAIDESDVRDAINAAQAIGDDRLQKASQGYVVPENFTHGSSEQRVTWFMTGLKTGKVEACDTFRSRAN